MNEPHAIYPGGPECQPNCPGPWSMYHDGYADGYERAEAARTEVAEKVRALPIVKRHPSLHPGDDGSYIVATISRAAVLAILDAENKAVTG